MTCNAIVVNSFNEITGKLCTDSCQEGNLFCTRHQSITKEEHKNRWFECFIIGVDGDPFLYKYNETHKDRIVGDLKKGIVSLSQEDILAIPSDEEYIDIYILLMEHGYIGVEENCHPYLYRLCIQYIGQLLVLANGTQHISWSFVGKKIHDVLILKNQNHLDFFLSMIAGFALLRTFREERFQERVPVFRAFLEELMNSDVGKSYLWNPFPDRLLKLYTKLEDNTKPNPVLDYMKTKFLPKCKELYKAEKLKQKALTNTFKEELMMVCWHPDRFVEYCLDEEEKREIKSLS